MRSFARINPIIDAKWILWAFMFGLLIFTGHASAREVTLAWDAVADDRVAVYEVHYGQQSGQYISQIDATSNAATITGLQEEITYYFAVRVCDQVRTLCSGFSNEVNTTVLSPAPTAAFNVSASLGVAPMTVDFTDVSSGTITDRLWDFGDGNTLSASGSVSHVYTTPGTYTVSLSVIGPGGTDTEIKPNIVEVGWPPPAADFTVNPALGVAPVTAIFNDASSGNVTERLWDFGDGSTSTATDAVYTYRIPGTYTVHLTVSGPGGTAAKSGTVIVTYPPPVADFTTSVRSGDGPLSVPFQDLSSGQISTWEWNFGDGMRSTERSPVHTYTHPGLYAVTLSVTGPGGTDTQTKVDYIEVGAPTFVWETGEVTVDDRWQWVDFTQTYSDPIVIAKPMGEEDPDPAVVRVDSISSTGFWIRIQEWDYQDGTHSPETVNYLVVESGAHQLPDGTRVEAGRLHTDATGAFTTVEFMQTYTATPVVLAAVTTVGEIDAVTSRIRNVGETGFEVGMSEQEANEQIHVGGEAIDYIAWPPSIGTIDGVRFEVGRTRVVVKDSPYRIVFDSDFAYSPSFMADMQTTNNDDTANLRLRSKTSGDAEVWVQEETSLDSETRHHRKEVVGYMVFDMD